MDYDKNRLVTATGGCRKCFDSGIVMAYRKDDSHQNMHCFTCNCGVGVKTRNEPGHRFTRAWDRRNGEWVVDLERPARIETPDEPCPF